eukprot:2580210-Alexandrium_andersonii.AAC.1
MRCVDHVLRHQANRNPTPLREFVVNAQQSGEFTPMSPQIGALLTGSVPVSFKHNRPMIGAEAFSVMGCLIWPRHCSSARSEPYQHPIKDQLATLQEHECIMLAGNTMHAKVMAVILGVALAISSRKPCPAA